MQTKRMLFGQDGLTYKDIDSMTYRNRFSNYLPWIAYDPETKIYLNEDNTIGFMWECGPLSFGNQKTMSTLEGLFRIGFPKGTIMQFILYADNDILSYLNAYRRLKMRQHDIVQMASEKYIEYFRKGAEHGMKNISNIPLRDFKLYVTVKMDIEDGETRSLNMDDLRNSIEEILSGAHLYPYPLPPEGLIGWMRKLFNASTTGNIHQYDENIPIKKQVIYAETIIRKSNTNMEIGNKFFRCTTPKNCPKEVDFMQTNQLFGGIWGIRSDTDQVRTPFLYTLNIIFENMKSHLHTKCNMILQQQGVGSFAPSLMRRKDENLWAVDELEKGTKFVKIMPILWVFGDDEKAVNESIVRAKRVWESQGYIMQEDIGILPILFVSSLPYGLIYNKGKNVQNIDRDFIVPSYTSTSILPIQSDFSGGGKPILMMVGRKGQVCGMDLFDDNANNHNAFIVASSGSGKSFLVNYIAFNYFASGAMIRTIDIGGSYKKMTKLCNARYLDFSREHDLCMNPFTNVYEEEFDLPVINSIVAQMVYSSSEIDKPSETDMTLIKNAVNWAYRERRNSADIDLVYEYLKTYPNHTDEKELADNKNTEEIISKAHMIAFNLKEFTSEGRYGHYFNGDANFNISRDEFVVLELEYLKPQKELFKVITLQVLNAVTQDLYLSDRSRPRLIIFDEAWQFINEDDILQKVIEEAFRRCRKYYAGMIIVSQSLLDLKQFGSVGDVIRANAAFQFFLESPDFEKARAEKLIDYDEFTMEWLKTLKSNRPRYSEIFMDTPYGIGIARLSVDPFNYYVYTSSGPEIAEMETMVEDGLSYRDAIQEMVKKYRSG